ncbi:MAG: Gfo/Idh/MocA family oxidoreductase [Pedosphaera sp.]|nr:Gfo/Idh/MocA family oxidoreductase [Pedosphaera sp.]
MAKKLIMTISRRKFIGASAASAFALTYLPSHVFGANERLRIAGIGVGGKGSSDIDQAGQFGDVVALCDADSRHLDAKAVKFATAKKFSDFRQMFEKMGKEIDAVTVSTPDHTHAPAAMMAMKLGIHVYCQKPLTHSVYEARLLRDTARKQKVCTQMGNQGTAENGLREAVEVIRSGAIGPVREVHIWTNRPVWPQAPGIVARPTDTPAVPEFLNWDAFLGPAPERPYHSAYHPFKWRGWWDFGTGALGDMACHTSNMAFMALKLGHPNTIAAVSGEINPETFPAWATITYQFPARGDMPPVKMVWYEGKTPDGKKNLPPAELLHGEVPPGSGSLLVGDKGVLYSPNDYGAVYKLLPKEKFEGYVKPEPTLARNGKGDGGMKEEWTRAIKENKPAIAFSNFDHAAMFTETILLGNVAMRVGKKLEWDGPNLKVTNCPEAAQYIKRPYRKGWEL